LDNKYLIWIIDRQHWPRTLLRAELIERGFDAGGFEEITDALNELGKESALRPRVIVVELREQERKQEHLDKLIQIGIPLIILGDETELSEQTLKMHQRVAVMKRPMTIGEVADMVEEIAENASDNGL
jgi:DNA-binding NtrC family response regulator